MKISSWPYFDSEQIASAANVLSSGNVNRWTGNETTLFEDEFSKWSNNDYSIAVSNGSVALTSAYMSIGLEKGTEFITTPRTFIATTSCAVLLGAKPIFADVDHDSGAITAESIEPLISSKTKAISVVHLAGWPADMTSIRDLAKSNNLMVIEDCSQAHGARIKTGHKFKPVGSFGDVSTWSFCQDKIITTGGEGGMVATNSKELFKSVWSSKEHGKSFDLVNETNYPPGYRWLHETFGTNYRMTEFQSAIGRIQLKNLEKWKQKRKENATKLRESLSDLSVIRIPWPDSGLDHAWYKFYCFINIQALVTGWNRDRIIAEISSKGYPAFQGGCSEIYLEKCFSKMGLGPKERLPIAKELGETSMMFLVHPTITKEEMESYTNTIRSVLNKAIR